MKIGMHGQKTLYVLTGFMSTHAKENKYIETETFSAVNFVKN